MANFQQSYWKKANWRLCMEGENYLPRNFRKKHLKKWLHGVVYKTICKWEARSMVKVITTGCSLVCVNSGWILSLRQIYFPICLFFKTKGYFQIISVLTSLSHFCSTCNLNRGRDSSMLVPCVPSEIPPPHLLFCINLSAKLLAAVQQSLYISPIKPSVNNSQLVTLVYLVDKKLQNFFWSEKNGGSKSMWVPTWNPINNLPAVSNHRFADHSEDMSLLKLYTVFTYN